MVLLSIAQMEIKLKTSILNNLATNIDYKCIESMWQFLVLAYVDGGKENWKNPENCS